MNRIHPLEPPYEPEVDRTLQRMMGATGIEPLKLFRTVAHNPHVLDRFRSTGAYFLNFGTLEPLDRELVIHRTCARCGSEYEWGVHAAIYGGSLGLSEEQLAATVHGTADDGVWSEPQALLIRLVDELHETATITDPLWEALAERWREDQLVELLALVGQYHMVSFFTNGAGVALEGFAPRFPPAR